MSRETFTCRFRGGCTATVILDMEAIERGENANQAIKIEWTGTPSRKVIPDYVRWMHGAMSQLAKRINKRIIRAYPPGGGSRGMAYAYYPDGTFQELKQPTGE